VTTWNDANGAAFMLIGTMPTILRASDAIYQRASWAWWSGGRILTNRQQGSAINITVDDLIASDPFPTMNAISLDLRPGAKSGSNATAPATLRGVTIRNFHARNFSTMRSCPSWGGGCGCVPDCAASGALPCVDQHLFVETVGVVVNISSVVLLLPCDLFVFFVCA
jgi:hypothetical protein